ncbi:BbrUII/HgiDII family restriction enzyme [Bifidobacterium italicum]|nr:ATP-binding protein [Bifidobacterium italicum]
MYTLTVDMATVDSLGRNLYSNAAAVLSEFVANAWDADANNVNIDYNPDEDSGSITITDDGCGMDADTLNSRFLTVGYQKRKREGDESCRFHRKYMGRKGIGKLSAFSLADIMRVESKKEGADAQGFTIDVAKLDEAIKSSDPNERQYHPVPISQDGLTLNNIKHGTKLILTNLRRKRIGLTLDALRRRIARRFDVLDLADRSENDGMFRIVINGQPVTYEDRGDLQRLEHIWYLGDFSPSEGQLNSIKAEVHRVEDVSFDGHPDWKLSGWIGTVHKPTDRAFGDDTESMKNIIVVARKRPIQEGLLDHLDFNRNFASYVTGQVQADFLDDSQQDDIATSDRQRLVESDERVKSFNEKMKDIFNRASDEWSRARSDANTKRLMADIPEVAAWIDSLSEGMRKPARDLIDRVSRINSIPESDRRSLYQSSIMAFTRLVQRGDIKKLCHAGELSTEQLLAILTSYKDYENMEYAQVVRTRLEVIDKLEGMLKTNELENATRDFVSDNPWLLDPSWERATRNVEKERAFRTIGAEEYNLDFSSDSESNSRVDIKYLTAPDRETIVEFKRYGRDIKIEEIRKQVRRYANAMTRILDKDDARNNRAEGRKNEAGIDERVNVLIIVRRVLDDDGNPLSAREANVHVDMYRAKFLYFSDILTQSRERYQEFVKDVSQKDYAGEAIQAIESAGGTDISENM